MSDFRCPYYWWDGKHWRCLKIPNDYLSRYDYDTFCTKKDRCADCRYFNK